MRKKIDIALIGCGRIARLHLEACKAVESVNLAAVADVNEEAAMSIAEEFQCEYYSSYKALLNRETLDAVIICTPPCTHGEIAKRALAAGIHVLCEKPFAICSKAAHEMVKVAQINKKLLMMASKFRFVRDVIKTKAMIESGMFGKIILFENTFCSHVDMKGRWNSQKRISGGGVFADNGPHSVDIVRFLLGPIVAIQAQSGKQMQDFKVEDTCRLYFKTSSVMGTIDLSWSINKNNEYYISVYGTEGSIHIGWRDSHYRRNGQTDWVSFGNGYNKFDAFARQLSHFIGCLNGKEKPVITSKDAVESVRVIELAYQSMRINKWLKLKGDK